MDRRRKLATAGAISLTATAAVVAVASSVGLFGLTDDNPRVGKLSPIDSTQPAPTVKTVYVDEPVAPPAAGTGSGSSSSSGSGSNVSGEQRSDDDGVSSTPTGGNTLAPADADHLGDDHHESDSSHSDDDDSHETSSSGIDHDDD